MGIQKGLTRFELANPANVGNPLLASPPCVLPTWQSNTFCVLYGRDPIRFSTTFSILVQLYNHTFSSFSLLSSLAIVKLCSAFFGTAVLCLSPGGRGGGSTARV